MKKNKASRRKSNNQKTAKNTEQICEVCKGRGFLGLEDYLDGTGNTETCLACMGLGSHHVKFNDNKSESMDSKKNNQKKKKELEAKKIEFANKLKQLSDDIISAEVKAIKGTYAEAMIEAAEEGMKYCNSHVPEKISELNAKQVFVEMLSKEFPGIRITANIHHKNIHFEWR